MRENKIEERLGKQVKALRGWSIKFLPSVSGLPDRIVLLPGGRIYFVELKAPKKTTAVHQEVVHGRLAELGFPVIVLDTIDKVDTWVSSIKT